MYRPDNVAYAHIDVRTSGNNAIPHKYAYNTSTATYSPYTENWWDSDSYHSLGVSSNQFLIDGSVVWNAGNDGAGSGLDADLLDGQHGTYYYAASNPNGYTTNTGTVTSVTVSAGTGLSGGGTVTTSGTITVSLSTPVTVANGGTGATSFTAGRVLFGNGTSAINTSANLFWDNTNSRLGLATSSPAYLLDVNGSMAFRGSSYAYDSILYAYNSSNGKYLGFTTDASGGKIWMTDGTSPIQLQTSGGNVGINTTSPSEKLHVEAGNIYVNGESTGIIVDAGGNKRVGFMKYAGFEGALVHGNAVPFRIGQVNQASVTGGTFTTQVSVDNSGNMVVLANITAYGSPSDQKLKTNINPITNALEKINKLQGVTFTWKEETDAYKITGLKNDIGFIAQQVQEVLPELVREDDSGTLGLRDKGIIPLLVEAIKEQQSQIDDLKKELREFKGDTNE